MVAWERQTNETIARIQLVEHSTVDEVSSPNHLTVKEIAPHHNTLLEPRLPMCLDTPTEPKNMFMQSLTEADAGGSLQLLTIHRTLYHST